MRVSLLCTSNDEIKAGLFLASHVLCKAKQSKGEEKRHGKNFSFFFFFSLMPHTRAKQSYLLTEQYQQIFVFFWCPGHKTRISLRAYHGRCKKDESGCSSVVEHLVAIENVARSTRVTRLLSKPQSF